VAQIRFIRTLVRHHFATLDKQQLTRAATRQKDKQKFYSPMDEKLSCLRQQWKATSPAHNIEYKSSILKVFSRADIPQQDYKKQCDVSDELSVVLPGYRGRGWDLGLVREGEVKSEARAGAGENT